MKICSCESQASQKKQTLAIILEISDSNLETRRYCPKSYSKSPGLFGRVNSTGQGCVYQNTIKLFSELCFNHCSLSASLCNGRFDQQRQIKVPNYKSVRVVNTFTRSQWLFIVMVVRLLFRQLMIIIIIFWRWRKIAVWIHLVLVALNIDMELQVNFFY